MNKLLKNLKKIPMSTLLIVVISIIAIVCLLTNNSNDKVNVVDSMGHLDNHPSSSNSNSNSHSVAQPLSPDSLNNQYEKVGGDDSNTQGLPPSSNVNVPNPAELLPKDLNNEWSRLNPSGEGDLENINLLKAGYHAGVDTVGSSLRNANLQVRSEPPNPTNKVSPWLNSTIEPDLMRAPLEIGARV